MIVAITWKQFSRDHTDRFDQTCTRMKCVVVQSRSFRTYFCTGARFRDNQLVPYSLGKLEQEYGIGNMPKTVYVKAMCCTISSR